MNDIIEVQSMKVGAATIQTANARELHTFLEVGQKFSDWIKFRINQYEFVEGEDFTVDKTVSGPTFGAESTVLENRKPQNTGFAPIEYHISMDMAKELSMVENNAKGREARKYFIASEKEMRRLQIDNTKLLEKQTKTLQIENKSLTRKNDELDDRNEYLEGKKTLLIDGHLEKCLREELTAERTERQRLEEQMFLDECGSTSLDVKACVRFVKQRMKAVDKHLKDLERFAKKSEMASTLEDYTDRIRSELSFYRNW